MNQGMSAMKPYRPACRAARLPEIDFLRCLSMLEENAVQRTGVDVREDDQLLLLVTCLDDPDKRRVLVARRVREGEDETALRALCSGHTAE